MAARAATARTGHLQLKSRGFTLLEVIVVLALGVVIYGMVLTVPFGKASAADLKAAARSLAAGLRTAQSSAMATRRDALLTIDMEAREYIATGEQQVHTLPSRSTSSSTPRRPRSPASRAARSVSIPTAAPRAGASPSRRASASTWWT
jgi:prepilin-type N-terminal cleavage/methylation domain-containing protein